MEDYKKIRMLRLLRNYDQNAIADYLDISQNTLSKIERGEIKLKEERKLKLLNFFGLSPEDFESLTFGDNSYIIQNNSAQDNAKIVGHEEGSPELSLALREQYESRIKELKDEVEFLKNQNTQILNLLNNK